MNKITIIQIIFHPMIIGGQLYSISKDFGIFYELILPLILHGIILFSTLTIVYSKLNKMIKEKELK